MTTVDPTRVSVRRAQTADAQAIAAIETRLRPLTAGIDPVRPDDYYTAAGQHARIEDQIRLAAEDRRHSYTILVDGEVAGAAEVSNVVRQHLMSANVGYHIDPLQWGRGIMPAALARLVDIGFGELGLHRLEAGTRVDNVRSQRVLEKTGFERIGLARRYLFVGGAWQDHILFQRTAGDDVVPQA